MIIRRTTSIPLGVCFTYEQLFRSVQCTPLEICQYSSIEKLGSSILTGILSFSDQPHYL